MMSDGSRKQSLCSCISNLIAHFVAYLAKFVAYLAHIVAYLVHFFAYLASFFLIVETKGSQVKCLRNNGKLYFVSSQHSKYKLV